jgi:hypothetical protein
MVVNGESKSNILERGERREGRGEKREEERRKEEPERAL